MTWTSKIWSIITASKAMIAAAVILLIWLVAALLEPILLDAIGYSYSHLNPSEGLLPPFTPGDNGIHLLGTDSIGRDVTAGMIHGGRVSFIIAMISMFVSLLVGLSVGLIAGFYGDQGIRKNLLQQVLIGLSVFLIGYYLFSMIEDGASIYNITSILFVIALTYIIDKLLAQLKLKKYGLPLDITIQRLFEFRESIPGLFIILSIAAVVYQPTIFTVAFIIAILLWFTFARHARAEAISIKEEDYIQSIKATGASDFRVLTQHILPNALPSLLVIIAFAFSAIILLEATMSFLGIGIPIQEVTWGKILAEARKTPKAWWLAIFPGLAIFLLLYAFNTIGDYFGQYQRRNDGIVG